MRVSIRISFIFWGLLLLSGFIYAITSLLRFKQIFFEHAGITLTQAQAAEAYAAGQNDERTQHIPKIVHQVFHNWHDPGNGTLPSDWQANVNNCKKLNPNFEFMLWTEKKSRDFIEIEYPWFLRTYDRYRYKVQRVDAVRYFLLLHYGGIYMDLDNGCKADLSPLLYYPVWVTDGGRGALSNNIIAAKPNHPFWTHLTMSLIPYDWNWFFPYVTISFASGQWFETAVWERYHSLLPKPSENPEIEHRLYRLMMDDRPEADEWIFFTQERGGTWVNWDNRLFLALGDHLFLFFATLAVAVGLTIGSCTRFVRRYKSGYSRLKAVPDRVV
ncbi:nucleotide-diphospho-sugar transferase [Cladorrhinum samala]|uniref:Nucleotide-diphospho-sugar transferase n=1 Tax=Cladorrhinum samala TaxID=585594 RepID=A0AAV9I5H6_9PEZI|nr:nucleotide-diphospho-sugar transferase [Cladorrhinum samala]